LGSPVNLIGFGTHGTGFYHTLSRCAALGADDQRGAQRPGDLLVNQAEQPAPDKEKRQAANDWWRSSYAIWARNHDGDNTADPDGVNRAPRSPDRAIGPSAMAGATSPSVRHGNIIQSPGYPAGEAHPVTHLEQRVANGER